MFSAHQQKGRLKIGLQDAILPHGLSKAIKIWQ
jgi:hypothetical protein